MIKDLPEKLKLLRVKYGYSQKQVADKVNISPSIISGYETGERTPSTDVLLSLSNIYNCSVDYLLGKQNIEPPVCVHRSSRSPRPAELSGRSAEIEQWHRPD